ncbi:2955_t:CDS:2 [Ambispora leptoticha]|uniref:2955_t:CDS:1 n=1 Tax=Ambispora leptoticha TaxID=144679 RepID=A0A9N9FP70_9GLOM|nr:2955_t:CDS:2 [Ambispora leptoticha]
MALGRKPVTKRADPYPKNVRGAQKKRKTNVSIARKVKLAGDVEKIPIPSLPSTAGHVFVVGNGECGQLGAGEMQERKKFGRLSCFDGKEVVEIAVGPLHNVAITRQGKMYTWGCNDHGALGRVTDEDEERTPGLIDETELKGVKIMKAACGGSLTIALSDEGNLYATGTFKSEDGIIGFSSERPRHQQYRFALYEPASLLEIADIACGVNHAALLTTDGHVYTWGSSEQFQLGRRGSPRHKSLTLVPEIVNQLKKLRIVKIGCGNFHTLAADDEGHIYAWGLNNARQCLLDPGKYGGIHIKEPTQIPFFENVKVKQLAAGMHHSVVLLENGQVYTFGSKENGKLGLGGDETSDKGYNAVADLKPLDLPVIKLIAVGDFHNYALTEDGKIYSWGDGVSGQLGNGEETCEYTPYLIEDERFEDQYHVKQIGCGSQHTVMFGIAR